MKVKILYDYYMTGLEDMINEFIKDKEVINISFSDACSNDGIIGSYSALILYKEEEIRDDSY